MRYARICTMAALLGSTAVTGAWAQDANQTPQGNLPGSVGQNASAPNATSPGQATDRVEEIVVTAERRETNLQRTPIAITALTQANIESQTIRNVTDLASTVPNLTTTTGPQGSADANFFIRGIGQFDFIATNDPAIGVYVDGVYLGRTVGALLDAGDIGRVEVLRGPQGTLFGRNTLGGAVSITSPQPSTKDVEGRVRVTAGDRHHFDIDGAINLPLGDKAAIRFYAFSRQQDGYARNPVNDKVFGATERWGGKAELLLKPTERLTINVMGDYTKDKSNPAPRYCARSRRCPSSPSAR